MAVSIAATLPFSLTMSAGPPALRDTQSSVFFNSADTDALFSGEAISKPWCSLNSVFSLPTFSGRPSRDSMSPL